MRLVAAVLVIGSSEDHAWKVENQKPCQQYLRRAALLPNPHIRTPWTCLYASYEDRAFIMTMGVDTATFRSILTAGFGHLWDTLPILHTDTHNRIFSCGEELFGCRGWTWPCPSLALINNATAQSAVDFCARPFHCFKIPAICIICSPQSLETDAWCHNRLAMWRQVPRAQQLCVNAPPFPRRCLRLDRWPKPALSGIQRH